MAPVHPCDVVVFGGTGDLSMRKILPALYHRDRDGQLTPDARVVAVSRDGLDDSAYRALADELARPHAGKDLAAWPRFLERLHHVTADATAEPGWDDLAALVAGAEHKVRVFYLACAPQLYGAVCRRLAACGVVTDRSRVVLEKPIGWDLASARGINDEVGAVFAEDATFRIDHYLGKETVQNLQVLRFANTLLEPLWTSQWIDHVQITVAETVGVGRRGGYYDSAGAMRDMVQNHLLQLLCLVAMEPPARVDEDAVRDEKVKVLKALRPMTPDDVARSTVRGQYRSGAVGGCPVPGYCDDLGGAASGTETFVALKTHVDTWRWAGTPFYLRTGKRLHTRTSEIVVQFKPVPHRIFGAAAGPMTANRLVLHLQPDESVRLHLMAKEPGPGGLRLRPAPLNVSFADTFGAPSADAYERLLMDVVRGNPSLFMRRDEVETAWAWSDQVLHAWASAGAPPQPYHAGTTGPPAAIALIERDGRTWHEETFA
ncbi:MAG: glucose-6-phosphate dehydrogenase [Actinomycetes bacterium]